MVYIEPLIEIHLVFREVVTCFVRAAEKRFLIQ